MAPVVHVLRRRGYAKQAWLALMSFTLVNLWIDFGAINAVIDGTPLPSHDEPWHTLHGALLAAMALSLLGILSWGWVAGAFYGAVSHIYLDGMVHPEMQPFVDTEPGNPIYMGWLVPLSLCLIPFTIWLIAQIVSCSLGWVKSRWSGHSPPPDQRSS
jgi:membrane-bound metal-dependent hydrolase YbcI (DUF457 family)